MKYAYLRFRVVDSDAVEPAGIVVVGSGGLVSWEDLHVAVSSDS